MTNDAHPPAGSPSGTLPVSDDRAAELTRLTVAALDNSDGIDRVVRVHLLPVTDTDFVAAAKVALTVDAQLSEVTSVLALARDNVADAVPEVHTVYLEPTFSQPPSDDAPPTDVFILKSED